MPDDPAEPDDIGPDATGPGLRDLTSELERADKAVKLQGIDEERTMFDPAFPPKRPHKREEGITDRDGEREVDLMSDTENLDDLTTDVDPAHGELLDAVDLRDVEIL